MTWPMRGATTLIDVGQLQSFDRVGYLLQVLLREVKIPSCHLQIFVPEQKLDGTQIGAGFK